MHFTLNSQQSDRSRISGLISLSVLLICNWHSAHAQLTVEGFPDLELTDFSYVSQERRDTFTDESLQKYPSEEALLPHKH